MRPERLASGHGRHARGVVLLAVLLAAGCAGAPAAYRDPVPDPIEPVNRGVYAFNRGLDRVTLRPLARGYEKLPTPMRTGVGNFFRNLGEPGNIVNGVLQGKFSAAGRSTARLLMNTVFGIGGLLDPASAAGLRKQNESFAQTLAVWGVPSGPYLMLPLLGPSSLRDGFAMALDAFTNPLAYVEERSVRDKLIALEVLDLRASLLAVDRAIDEAPDPYIFVRESYVQRMNYVIFDGDPPESGFDEEQWDDADWDVAPPATDRSPR